MAKLVCVSCGAESPVPTVCCGHGVKGKDPEKLYFDQQGKAMALAIHPSTVVSQ